MRSYPFKLIVTQKLGRIRTINSIGYWRSRGSAGRAEPHFDDNELMCEALLKRMCMKLTCACVHCVPPGHDVSQHQWQYVGWDLISRLSSRLCTIIICSDTVNCVPTSFKLSREFLVVSFSLFIWYSGDYKQPSCWIPRWPWWRTFIHVIGRLIKHTMTRRLEWILGYMQLEV